MSSRGQALPQPPVCTIEGWVKCLRSCSTQWHFFPAGCLETEGSAPAAQCSPLFPNKEEGTKGREITDYPPAWDYFSSLLPPFPLRCSLLPSLPSLILPFALAQETTRPQGFSMSLGFSVNVTGSFSNSHANWIQRINTENFKSIFSSYHRVALLIDLSYP